MRNKKKHRYSSHRKTTIMTRLGRFCVLLLATCLTAFASESVDGIRALADRVLNGHGDDFDFVLTVQHEPWSRWNIPDNDNYSVSACDSGNIRIEGTTLSALSRGYVGFCEPDIRMHKLTSCRLRHYMNEMLQLDDYWFIESQKPVPESLPRPKDTLKGASVVPWRYNLNTGTSRCCVLSFRWQGQSDFLVYFCLV